MSLPGSADRGKMAILQAITKSLNDFIINSCTKEDEIKTFDFVITNSSTESLTISFLNQGLVIFSENIENDSSYSCSYTAEVNTLISECIQEGIDGVEIDFNNGKGYLCYMSNLEDNSICFSDSKSFFSNSSYNNIGNNRYEFVITEEDFNNAHELPE